MGYLRDEALDDGDGNWLHDKFELKWLELTNFLRRYPTEPFEFQSRGRKLFDVASIVFLSLVVGVTGLWQVTAGIERQKRLETLWRTKYNSDQRNALYKCVWVSSWNRVVFELFVCVAICATIHVLILLIASVRCKSLYPRRQLDFSWKRDLGLTADELSAAKRHPMPGENSKLKVIVDTVNCVSSKSCRAEVSESSM